MSFTKTKQLELAKKLRKLFDDDDFVLGCLCDLETDAEADSVLEYLKENPDVESSEVILFTMDIDRNRNTDN